MNKKAHTNDGVLTDIIFEKKLAHAMERSNVLFTIPKLKQIGSS